ncbi:hypothetical protein D3C84_242150 [compost metagenome]
MASKLRSYPKIRSYCCILIFLLFNFSIVVNAQCAGQDNAITVCNILDPSSQSIDLSSLLGPHTLGGTWTDDAFSGGLNQVTGQLNAQLIRSSGIYTYTYSLDNINGCTDSAQIVVTIGGYSGVAAPNASVCSDDTDFNLFQVFDGTSPSPHINGTWIDNDNTNALFGYTIDASLPIAPGTYSFTYTVAAIGSCPSQSTTVYVSIFPAPKPGKSVRIELCSDQLVSYTNFNLNNFLHDEDDNGVWTENGTSEIADPSDSNVNIQNIYDSGGEGVYNFSYTVISTNPICKSKTSGVEIIIEKQLDYSGSALVINSDICENEITTATYEAVLNQGTQNIPDGTYDIIYTISGVTAPIKTTSEFNNGVLTFPIPSVHFLQIGDYTITILDIISHTSRKICKNIIGNIFDVLHVYELPKINNATLEIDAVCQNTDAIVNFSGTSNLTDGNYEILYELHGSNIAAEQSIVVQVKNGVTSFAIPAVLIPNSGPTLIAITRIRNQITNCSNTSTLTKMFTINSLPDISNLAVTVKDICQNQPLTVELSGLDNVTSFTLDYNLSGAITSSSQVTLKAKSGNYSFIISSSELPNIGTSVFNIMNLTNASTGCSVIVSNSTTFTINAIPSNPVVSDQEFCKTDHATVSSLVPNGNQFQWFDSASSTTILNADTLLVNGEYFVKEINEITGCESGLERTKITIHELNTPILNSEGEKFCGLDNPTLQNLSENISSNGQIVWFDSQLKGIQLANTELLKEGFTYYGFDFSTSTNCFSENPVAVTVSLKNCNPSPDFFIPDGFSPNGDGINDTFRIPDIEFIYPNFSLEIYNRYGNLMFRGNENKLEWDGNSSDSTFEIQGMASNGVYFYIINFNKNNKPPRQGKLYLNR